MLNGLRKGSRSNESVEPDGVVRRYIERAAGVVAPRRELRRDGKRNLHLKLTRSKIMKKWNIVGIAAAVGLAAVTFHAYAADKLKVGFIYVGPIGDLGWSYQHDLGRKAMEKALGDKVETTY